MHWHIIYSIIILNFGISQTFNTSMGKCSLEIYGGKIEDIPEIVQLIKDETKKLINEYGVVKKRAFSIYITSNLIEFYQKSKGPVPEWGIAVAKKNPDRIILKAPVIANISFIRMKEVLKHEINHIYLYRIPMNFSMPSWFKEGMAMRNANEFSLLYKIDISNSQLSNQILPLNKLHSFKYFSKKSAHLAYGESAAAVEALQYYYGDKILLNILNNMRQKMDFMQAFEFASKEKFIEFEIKFETYLNNNYSWIFLLKSQKYLYTILPIILVISYIYHKIRNKKIIKKWEMEDKLDNSELEDFKLN